MTGTARRRAAAAVVLTISLLTACGTPTGSGGPASTTTRSNPTGSTSHSVGDAAALVRRIYDPYGGASAETAVLGNCFWPGTGRPCPGPVDDYMAAPLIDHLDRLAHEGTGMDPVDCGQNSPIRVSYDPPTASGGTAVIVVHTFYGDPAAETDHPIRVVVDLATLRLVDLVCPGPR